MPLLVELATCSRSNFDIFTQERPLMLKLGIIFGEIPLVVDFINLA